MTKSPEQSQTPPPVRLFGIKDAAVYCGLAARTLKYHIYESGELKADANVGHSLVFTQATLDDFLKRRRPVGRPKASAADSSGSDFYMSDLKRPAELIA